MANYFDQFEVIEENKPQNKSNSYWDQFESVEPEQQQNNDPYNLDFNDNRPTFTESHPMLASIPGKVGNAFNNVSNAIQTGLNKYGEAQALNGQGYSQMFKPNENGVIEGGVKKNSFLNDQRYWLKTKANNIGDKLLRQFGHAVDIGGGLSPGAALIDNILQPEITKQARENRFSALNKAVSNKETPTELKIAGSRNDYEKLKEYRRNPELANLTQNDVNNFNNEIELRKNILQGKINNGEVDVNTANKVLQEEYNDLLKKSGLLEKQDYSRIVNQDLQRKIQNVNMANEALNAGFWTTFALELLTAGAITVPLIGGKVVQKGLKNTVEKAYIQRAIANGVLEADAKAMVKEASQIGLTDIATQKALQEYSNNFITQGVSNAATRLMGKIATQGTIAAGAGAIDLGLLNAGTNEYGKYLGISDTPTWQAALEGIGHGAVGGYVLGGGATALSPVAKAIGNIPLKTTYEKIPQSTDIVPYVENPNIKYGYANGNGFYTPNPNVDIPKEVNIEDIAPNVTKKQQAKKETKLIENKGNKLVEAIAPKTVEKTNQIADTSKMVNSNEEKIAKLESKIQMVGKDTMLGKKYQAQIDELRGTVQPSEQVSEQVKTQEVDFNKINNGAIWKNETWGNIFNKLKEKNDTNKYWIEKVNKSGDSLLSDDVFSHYQLKSEEGYKVKIPSEYNEYIKNTFNDDKYIGTVKQQEATVSKTENVETTPTNEESSVVENNEVEKLAKEYSTMLGQNEVRDFHRDFANALINKNADSIINIVAQGRGMNENSKKLFTKYTGIKLPSTIQGKKDVINAWANGKTLEVKEKNNKPTHKYKVKVLKSGTVDGLYAEIVDDKGQPFAHTDGNSMWLTEYVNADTSKVEKINKTVTYSAAKALLKDPEKYTKKLKDIGKAYESGKDKIRVLEYEEDGLTRYVFVNDKYLLNKKDLELYGNDEYTSVKAISVRKDGKQIGIVMPVLNNLNKSIEPKTFIDIPKIEFTKKTDSVKEVKPKETKPKETKKENTKLQDSGEFLQGNRKFDTSLTWDDLEGMNDLIRAKNTTKAKVYPKPNIEYLKNEGFNEFQAGIIQNVYNKINAKPAAGYEGKENQKLYVDTINDVMKTVKSYIKDHSDEFSTDLIAEAAKNYRSWSYNYNKSLFNAVFPDTENKVGQYGNVFRHYKDYNRKALIIGGNKFTGALQLDSSTLRDVVKTIEESKKVKETGEKVKKENWEKEFTVLEPDKWNKQYAVANRRGSHILAKYDTKEEAINAAKRVYDRMQQLKAQNKKDNFERDYIERRENNKDVTAEDIQNAFGFRGVNFGNWATAKERQDFANFAYDSLYDLAELLNLPPKALSLNGQLGLAYGAQGHGGKAAAHYIPAYKEINLTKEYGAGSLAHEWWHALDNEFGNKSTGKEFSQEWALSLRDKGELRQELFDELKNLQKQIKETPFTEEDVKKNAENLTARCERNIKFYADTVKSDYSRAKNADELNSFIDDLVKNREKYKTYTFEQMQELENNFFKMLPENRDTITNRGRFSWITSEIRRLGRVDELAKSGANKSEYLKNAIKLDENSGKKYWSEDTELGARAFSSYLLDKMEKQSILNHFLVREEGGVLNMNAFKELAEGEERESLVIPTHPKNPAERERIFNAFDKLFDTIKTRETDKGVELYGARNGEIDLPKFESAYADKDHRFFFKNAPINKPVATIKDIKNHPSYRKVKHFFNESDDNVQIAKADPEILQKFDNAIAYYKNGILYLSDDFTIDELIHEITHYKDELINKNDPFYNVETKLYRVIMKIGNNNSIVKAIKNFLYKNIPAEKLAYKNQEIAQKLLKGETNGHFREITKRTPAFIQKIIDFKKSSRNFGNSSKNDNRRRNVTRGRKEESEGIDRRWYSTRNSVEKRNQIEQSVRDFDIENVDEILKKVKKEPDEVFKNIFTPISSRLDEISPSLKHAIRKFELNSALAENKSAEIVKPFIEKLSKMDKVDYAKYDLALKNGNKEVIDKINSKYNIGDDYKSIKKLLSNIRQEAIQNGLEVGEIEDYFPRKVINPSALLEEYSKSSYIKNYLKEIDPNNKLTTEEKINKINTALKGYNGAIKASSSFTKGRKISEIDKNLNRYYKDSKEALVDYITSMNNAIQTRKFFGNSEENIENSIGAFTKNLIDNGIIKPSDEVKLKKLLTSRFTQRSMHGAIKSLKNVGYITTMGNPLSAVTQLGDFAFSLYKNGIINTLSGVKDSVFKTDKITKKDLGIDRIAQEFENDCKTGKIVDKVFKIVGLNKIDSLAKETFINGAMNRNKKSAINALENINSKEAKEYYNYLHNIFGNETYNVLEDLKNEKLSDNVKYLLFSEISDFQPISLSEMPEAYLKSGNGRIFYMLKTYSIKLLDVYRNETYRQFKAGNKKKSIANLIKLGFYLTLLGVTSDKIKDKMLGRDSDIGDTIVDNILKMAMFSKYQLDKSKTEGIGKTIYSNILPPSGFIDDVWKDVQSVAKDNYNIKDFKTFRNIPVIGKMYYWWFGGGVETRDKEAKSKYKNEYKKAIEKNNIKLEEKIDKELSSKGYSKKETDKIYKNASQSITKMYVNQYYKAMKNNSDKGISSIDKKLKKLGYTQDEIDYFYNKAYDKYDKELYEE